jgi:PAS domain S-box-containing protein
VVVTMSRTRTPTDRRERRGHRATAPFHLTPREAQILAFVLRGWTNKEMASDLRLSEQSVKDHVSALLQKFAVPNRAALAEAGGRFALTGGIAFDPQWVPQLFREAEPQIGVARGPEFRLEAVNDAFVKAVGNRPLLGRTVREAFPELEGQGIFEMMERVYATGEPVVQHERTSNWDRGSGVESRLVDLVIQPLRDEAGVVNGVVSFAVDVTDLVRQRRQAALIVDGFAAVLELVPRGVIVVDDHGAIITMNAVARRIGGVPDATTSLDLQARDLFASWSAADQVLGPDDMPIDRGLRGDTIIDAESDYVTGSAGRSVRVRVSVRPLRGGDGVVRGAIIEFAELT